MVLLPYPNDPRLGPYDLEAKGKLYHVGALFEALFMGVLMAAWEFSCNFFSYPKPGVKAMYQVSKQTAELVLFCQNWICVLQKTIGNWC